MAADALQTKVPSLLDPYQGDGTTLATLEVAGQELPNITRFSYRSDVLNLGDPFAVTLANPRGKWTGKLPVGATVKYSLTNKDANGGQKTPKLVGIITHRDVASDGGSGTVITLRGADLGWHLLNNSGPCWQPLQGITFQTMLNKVVDSSWGFAGVRTENDTNRKLKLGRAGAKIQLAPHVTIPLQRIQIEPGESIADVLILYAKRLGLLVNVSADGYLQVFTPNYSQPSRYVLNYHDVAEPESVKNNVERARLSETCESIYTEVTCVGEVVALPVGQAGDNPNVGKFRGRFENTSALPFLHRLVFADSEQLSKTLADFRATWRYQRGLFDSKTITYLVRGHHQNGVWWESDTMADVEDSVNGLRGRFYVSAVQCNRDMESGDTTEVTLKMPDLLGA